jgi:hypothetical protein
MASPLITASVLAAAATASCLLPPAPADAKITTLTINRTDAFADGASFGDVGAYVKIAGTAKGELDPADARNKIILNLDKAPRNAAGKVEYEVQFYIMRPADPAKGSGTLFYEVNNRGKKLATLYLDEAVAGSPTSLNDPSTVADAGNGFLFRRGYSLVWSGWDPDAPTANGGLIVRVPTATDHGKPIMRRVRDEFVFGTRVPETNPAAPLSFEAAGFDPRTARLTVRARETDPPQPIPANGWRFVDSRAIELLPEGTKFKPGYIYDFRYKAQNPKIVGIGFAATRDLVSFLRYEAKDAAGMPNPLGSSGSAPIKHAIGFGISQSGRYLRDYVGQGFNQDEASRKVFDGVYAHISGIGRVFDNEEFSQPNRTNTQHEDHFFPENAFPFAHAKMTDPVTGKTGALLRGDGFDPLVIESNTSTEYWQKGASLLETDPLGQHDVAVLDSVRLFMIAGTEHAGHAGLDDSLGSCINPRNPHNPGPALRALVVALEEWVNGTRPPASRVPTIVSGSLVPPAEIGFPQLPGITVPRGGNTLMVYGSWTDPKPEPRKAYVTKVSKVNADGNEVAGLRLPDIAVPLGTYTGWNLYKSPYPEGELCDREGTFLALAPTKAAREAKHDPRLSLEERYGSQAEYISETQASAAELVRARLLLEEDAIRYVEAARTTKAFQ